MLTVIFDMDGVLFDTERLCMEGWEQVAAKRGVTEMEIVSRKCIGLNANDTRHLVLKHYGEDFPYEEFKKEVSAWVWDKIKRQGLPVKKGVNKILAFLKQSGALIGLASSSKYNSVVSHLKEADIIDYFQVIVTGDMIEHSKPKPDIYLLACRKLGVDPEEVYAIEDSPNGIRAAAAAGVKPIMVPDMIKPDEEMKKLSFRICEDLPEVVRFLTIIQ